MERATWQISARQGEPFKKPPTYPSASGPWRERRQQLRRDRQVRPVKRGAVGDTQACGAATCVRAPRLAGVRTGSAPAAQHHQRQLVAVAVPRHPPSSAGVCTGRLPPWHLARPHRTPPCGAVPHLVPGHRQRPRPRHQSLRQPVAAPVVRRPGVQRLLHLGQPQRDRRHPPTRPAPDPPLLNHQPRRHLTQRPLPPGPCQSPGGSRRARRAPGTGSRTSTRISPGNSWWSAALRAVPAHSASWALDYPTPPPNRKVRRPWHRPPAAPSPASRWRRHGAGAEVEAHVVRLVALAARRVPTGYLPGSASWGGGACHTLRCSRPPPSLAATRTSGVASAAAACASAG